jgi:hypothetical protein
LVSTSSRRINKKQIAFIVGFAIIGILLVLRARASSPLASYEVENSTLNGKASVVSTTLASQGKAVQFGSVTVNPPPTTCTGPTVTLTGTTASKYTNASPAASTTFNLTTWMSTAVTGSGASQAFDIGGSSVPNGVCVTGGVVKGSIDITKDWRYVHDSVGGFGYRTAMSGLEVIDGARIHNVEDGWKPRECVTSSDSCATFKNAGAKMLMKNVYMTGIRDDSIEDDDFLPGDIQNSLFDGVWSFLSEQQQGSTGSGVGTGEDPNIRITNDYVRLYTTNPPNGGPGKWFKWQGTTSHHTLIITDSVFAVDHQPNTNPGSGWGNLSIPAGTQWKGTNYILWLGPVGTYGGPKPAGVNFVEGQQAIDKWNSVRNTWLSAHGYQQRPVGDFNPMDDPVVAPQ